MELTDEIYNDIVKLTNKGNIFAEKNKFKDALDCFSRALDLIPEPKNDWEASTWIYTALGDVYFIKKEFEIASDNLFNAYSCPDGYTNPFILLRLGQSLLEINNVEKAKEYLLRAYMLEGDSIFENEEKKYFNLIKDLTNQGKKESKFSLLIKKFRS